MNARETAWRLFASEFNSCTADKKAADEKMPSYVISPLGSMINRVMVAGILLDKENTGTEEEPMWRARINDVSGNTYIQVGRFQPEAMGEIANIPSPAFVVAIGKAKTFSFDDGKVRVSLRPERIIEVDESIVNLWTLEAAQSMWSRLLKMKEALEIPDVNMDQLKAKGFTATEAEGITMALDAYGFPQSQNYLKTIQAALKKLLPDSSIDFGLPENVSDLPDEIDMPGKEESKKPENAADAADREDVILRIIEELSGDPKGAPRDEVDRMAAMEGISANDVEEITTALMDKGLIYEPNLGYLKVI